MAVALLDVNVLVALAWSSHTQHAEARRWYRAHRRDGWATSTLTQAGFVRVSAQALGGKEPVPVADGLRILELALADRFHHFWPLETPVTGLLAEIVDRLRGPKQLTDALLLDLAIRRGGRLATFDPKIRSLLSHDSRYRAAVEVIG